MNVVDPIEHTRRFAVNEGASTSRQYTNNADLSVHNQFGGGMINNENNLFLPTIQVLGGERINFGNLGIDRVRFHSKFLNPPERGSMSLEEYNLILSQWLNRAFTTLLKLTES